jgi:multicomponent Na+:H+ antiporter subunit E
VTGGGDFSATIPLRPAVTRAVGLLGVWVVLSGYALVDLVPGVIAALAATWVSLRLLPSGPNRVQPLALTKVALRFLRQSVLAGADVARRALDPRLPLDPGFIRYSAGLPPSTARNAFTALMSLLPGTVPVGSDQSGALVIHCLDIRQPVAAQLATDEALFARVTGEAGSDG